mgnify:CR=1 FL=1
MIFISSKCLVFRKNQKIGLSILLLFLFTQPIVSQEFQSTEIANNVFVIPSLNSGFNREKHDGSANAGFIIGPSGVIVINTGGSYKIGKAIIDKIKQQTSTPVVMVLLTHVDQNFVFGAGAFSEMGNYIGAHDSTIKTIKERCSTCLSRLRSQHTELMENTSLIIPSVKLSETSSLVLGGTELVLIRYGADEKSVGLMVYHPITETLFAGGNLSSKKIPDIEDRNIDEWLESIKKIKTLPLRKVVPDYGAVIVDFKKFDTEEYLKTLKNQVQEMYYQSKSLFETIDAVSLTPFANWASYDSNHQKNVQATYLEVELDDFESYP